MENQLDLDSVRVVFEGKNVLNDIYLKCKVGEVVGLLGRNGCGKSTLLKVIAGLINPEYKFLKINDEVIKSVGFNFKVSYLDQDPFLPKSLSVKKAASLSLGAESLKFISQDEEFQKMSEKKVSQLSGGELRYLEICLVLFNEAEYCLLDEPYNGISPILCQKINALISRQSQFKGIIITDHNYENVIQVSHRLLLLENGNVKAINSPEELTQRGYLSQTQYDYLTKV